MQCRFTQLRSRWEEELIEDMTDGLGTSRLDELLEHFRTKYVVLVPMKEPPHT